MAIIGAMSKNERVNVPGRICIISTKRIIVLIIVALEAILRFNGFFVRNNTIEIIRKIKNKIAKTFPSKTNVSPLFAPSVGDNQGRNARINTERFMPNAVFWSRSSFSLEKEK